MYAVQTHAVSHDEGSTHRPIQRDITQTAHLTIFYLNKYQPSIQEHTLEQAWQITKVINYTVYT